MSAPPSRAARPARATGTALRAGCGRGAIELRQSFTNGGDLVSHLLWPVLMLITLFFLREREFGSSGLALGTLALPGILGMNAAMGMVSMSQILTAEREDGTLLRARATPNGMRSYLTGKVIAVAGGLVADLAILLVPAMFLIDGLAAARPGAWLTLAWVLVLGLVATLPIGAVLGSLFPSARSQGLIQLPVMGMIAISGIFYPVTALPGWLQAVAQVTPVYWLGLGMRSALLPGTAAEVEIGDSWRHWETAGVLGAWAVLGLLVAPVVLRRMARRESGSSVAERRERALRRIG
ncbi:ABC transporter permease [Streptomyces spectabilis]|uniref:Transport permease protein n=1 Tax=Streptomyces spectabilis TaxID=68270 RepID=A0A5P2XL78_STRST|nr:ABC transporter permease [Streptomyces spectabilis]MBB5102060.1 ABC-2 type transport system permease protein [Streptomyces spectabilis]MCI3907110.1 ABC transporter permease [Streptomyces spectabilis]QEV63875.1 ABC transporter permease [Streptomyces spectabilis]GGV35988.1 transport permease protein [Streptomyces spectabilis]